MATKYFIRPAILSLLLMGNIPMISALNPSCSPGGNFDLSKWQLQLPIGSEGSPETISSSDLQGCGGYEQSSYFYTDEDDGSLVMKVPSRSECVTTPNSLHCRTEFHEDSPSTWSPYDSANRLFGDLVVIENDDEVVVGQIHIDGAISTKPVAELYYDSEGHLTMGVQKCRTCGQSRFDIDDVPKGQRFTYEIRYENNVLSVSINGNGFQTLSTFDLDGPDSYFKAGNYNQGDSAAEVHFFSIRMTHTEGEDIGNSPKTSTTSGASTSQTSSANPQATSDVTCDGVPSIVSDTTVTVRLFAETDCCNALQTTNLTVLDTCYDSTTPFNGFYEAVGSSMFKRNIHVYTYTETGCSGSESSFKLTNQKQCWNSGVTWKSFKIAIS